MQDNLAAIESQIAESEIAGAAGSFGHLLEGFWRASGQALGPAG